MTKRQHCSIVVGDVRSRRLIRKLHSYGFYEHQNEYIRLLDSFLEHLYIKNDDKALAECTREEQRRFFDDALSDFLEDDLKSLYAENEEISRSDIFQMFSMYVVVLLGLLIDVIRDYRLLQEAAFLEIHNSTRASAFILYVEFEE